MSALSVLLALVALGVCLIGIAGHLPSRYERYAAFVASSLGCALVLASGRTFVEAVGLALQVTAAAAIGPRLAEEARLRARTHGHRAEAPAEALGPEPG